MSIASNQMTQQRIVALSTVLQSSSAMDGRVSKNSKAAGAEEREDKRRKEKQSQKKRERRGCD